MKQNLLVDYLVMSIKIYDGQECLVKFLERMINFPLHDAEKIRSYYGLAECYFFAGIKIHYDKCLLVLDMSGKGCRTCEELNPGWDWYKFLHFWDKSITEPLKGSNYGDQKGQYQVHISRIDLACDVLDDEKMTVSSLQNYVRKNKFICKSNYHTCVEGNKEMAVYFGSPRSSRRLRIYDKALEQALPDKKWVRFEIQLRDDNATSFYLNLSRTCKGDFSKCYYGMLHDYLRFITQPNNDMKNQARKKTCPFG